MAVYIMGDTHWGVGDEYKLLNLKANPEDIAIICGDAGFLWDGGKHDKEALEAVSELGFTVLVCPGNHENYDEIEKLNIVEKFGGSMHQATENVFYMCHGEIYEIEGKKYWNCGGAASIDKAWRTPHKSWWPQEIPKNDVVDKAVEAFENNVPDYAITHATPLQITAKILHQYALKIGPDTYMCNQFQYLMEKYPQVEWHCGHMHVDVKYDNCNVHYHDVFKVE